MSIILGNDPLLLDLGYTDLSSAEKLKVDAILYAGTELIEKYCNRTFALTTYTSEKHSGDGHNELYVKNVPLVSVTSVVVRWGDTTEDDDTYTSNYFEIDVATGRISFSDFNVTGTDTLTSPGCFEIGFNNLFVTYVAGFATVPAPVQVVLADFVLRVYNDLGENEIESEKLGNYFYKTKSSSSGAGKTTGFGVGTRYDDFLRLYKLHKV